MSISVRKDFQFFFHHRNPIQAKAVIQEAKRLIRNTPKELDLKRLVKSYEPLTEGILNFTVCLFMIFKGHYPILNKYPQFVVDYRKRETEKVRKREINFIKGKLPTIPNELAEDPFDQTDTLNVCIANDSLVMRHQYITNHFQVRTLTQSRSDLETIKSNRDAYNENASDFTRGIQDATRARKMLLASFSRDMI